MEDFGKAVKKLSLCLVGIAPWPYGEVGRARTELQLGAVRTGE